MALNVTRAQFFLHEDLFQNISEKLFFSPLFFLIFRIWSPTCPLVFSLAKEVLGHVKDV